MIENRTLRLGQIARKLNVGRNTIINFLKEKGYNIYEQVADERCEAAQSWWKANQELWAKVRNEWDRILASKERLKLKKKVDGKRLYTYTSMFTC